MSSPKEKAEKLVSKMRLNDCTDENIEIAKQCALIAVDEIINYCCADDVSFLYKVKEEINKL